MRTKNEWRLIEVDPWTRKLEWTGCEPVLMRSILDRFYSGLRLPVQMPRWEQLSALEDELRLATKGDILALYPLLCFRDEAWDDVLRFGIPGRLIVFLASKLPLEKVEPLIEIHEMKPYEILTGNLDVSREIIVRSLRSLQRTRQEGKSTEFAISRVLFHHARSKEADRVEFIKASLHLMSLEEWEGLLRINPHNELYRSFVWAYKWGVPFEIYDWSREDFMSRSKLRCRQAMDYVRHLVGSVVASPGATSLLLEFVLPEWQLCK